MMCLPPWVVLCIGSLCSPLLLLSTPQKWQLGFVYCSADSLPQLHMHAVIFGPLEFLCFVARGDICSGANILQLLQQRVLRPRSQPVSN